MLMPHDSNKLDSQKAVPIMSGLSWTGQGVSLDL